MNGSRLLALEREVSRRGLLRGLLRATAVSASLGVIAPRLWGLRHPTAEERKLALSIYSAIGNLTIPVDGDPGWASFDPGISDYGLNVFVRQVLLNGNDDAFEAYIEALHHVNDVPEQIRYNVSFLRMSEGAQAKYLTDILTGQFENDGWQDVLALAAGVAITSVKMTFFSNYPRHLATAGAEFQVLPPAAVKTGWDIMQWKGPVGPEEESALRAKYQGVVEVPGIDTRSPYL